MAQMLILSVLASNVRLSCMPLLRGFRAKCFRVRGCFLCQEVAAHLFNRDNSAFYRIPWRRCPIQRARAVSILPSHQSAIVDQTPRFDNSEFITNSSQSFLNLVITMDPNIKGDLSNTLPASGDGRRCSRNAVR